MIEKKPEPRRLGRGLPALMAEANIFSEPAPATMQRQGTFLPVERISPNSNQPRRDFAAASLEELAASIRQKGIVQPLIVRAMAGQDRFEIVAGERRWRAAQMAGLHEVPVVIGAFDDAEAIEVAIIENIQRADLNAIEEALAYKHLIERFGHTQEKLAEALSRSRSHVANLLRLLTLPSEVQNHLRNGDLTAGHARALITSPDPAQLAAQVIKRGLTVRETERLAKAASNPSPAAPLTARRRIEKDADTRAIETDLSANLGMLVQISHNGPEDGGAINIRYRTLTQLDLLCEVLSRIPRDISDWPR